MLRVSTNTLFATGEQNIVARQRELMATQTQLASGKRINTPSDDPLGAADIASIRNGLSQFEQFKENQGHARYLLSLGESSLEQFVRAVQDVQEKLVAAGNGAYGDNERLAIANELEGVLGRMVGLANSGDGAGGYLFAGSRENVVPFTRNGNSVSYSGDEILQRIEVSRDRFQQVKFSGDALFQKMRPGNGSFTTAVGATNTGSASIDVGAVTNPAALTGRPYTINLAVAAGVTTFTVVRSDAGGGTTNVAAGTYTNPTTISFDGVRVTLAGTPANGDSFNLAPSGYQSVFSTLAQAIAALRAPASGNAAAGARFQTSLGQAQASMQQSLDHLLLKRSDIGTALQELDAYERLNDDRQLQYQSRLSMIEDLDYAQGVAELSKRQANFEAAIRSYSTVSKLSLFDYL